ncbi:hypothetical protein SAMN04488072_102265 [Lentibacillus halodurans]|uniref:Uncharacterized protein n=1 Tax=Lentibacillus halodurans TaxID=237679 RepID=A0A1I0W7S5_9BACI|nr:CBO0543 family protein [Lentibacillus halodurans]SFA84320.1 hypothetical protein SAMN04488072_102265 [Lentibacillus halodurans]
MEVILLWLFLILGLVLLCISFKKPHLKDWLLCYLTAAYFAAFLGELVVYYQMLSYPVRLFPLFQSSVLYEHLLLPLVCIYYYQSSYNKGILTCLLKALLYSSVLAAFEILLEKNTDLIHYISWYWYYSLTSLFLFLLLVRSLMWLMDDITGKRENSSGS